MTHKMKIAGHLGIAAAVMGLIGASAEAGAAEGDAITAALQKQVQTIVVIYAENRSFDSLFGNFPRAHGLNEVTSGGVALPSYVAQKDRDGSTVLPKLPQTWNGVTAAGNPQIVTQAQSDNLPNVPFPIETAFWAASGVTLTTSDVTRDLAHRFFENLMEINGGTNDMYAAWLDAGGLTMGHFDSYADSQLYHLAQDNVLADEFFQGAYGGSFLNHQYLICACAPSVPGSFVANNHPSVNVLGAPNAKGVPQLATNSTSPASALDGPPSLKTGNIAPLDYFGTGDGYRAVNTMQPPYQPSGNFPALGATDLSYADPSKGNTLPALSQTNIGDLLTAQGVNWAWYATSWNNALVDGEQPVGSVHTVIYAPSGPRANPNFQAHHHPFNYYAEFDPATHAADRAAHLKDYNDLVMSAAAGTLPPVVFYKPTGYINQHPGYANASDGDAHIARLVETLQSSPQWPNMVIVITYDEYGGAWDHFPVPKGDLIGPGTRIPAIIVSPFARHGFVDHTPYDTASILRLIVRRFGLTPLPGLVQRDVALMQNGGRPMGDLTNALSLVSD